MTDHDSWIVSGLKDPWKFLFVDLDIAMAAASVSLALMTMQFPIPAVVTVGVGIGYFLHVSRKGKPKGFGRHLAYWYLPPLVSHLRRVPPVWAHRTVG